MSKHRAILIKAFTFLDITGHDTVLAAQTPVEVYQCPYLDGENEDGSGIEAGTFLVVCPGIDVCILPNQFLLV